MKEIKEQHTDSGFVQGFERYLLATWIIKNENFSEYTETIKEHKQSMFKEIKFFNAIIVVEHQLTDYLEKLNEEDDFSTDLLDYLSEKVKRYRKAKDLEEAKKYILKECDQDVSRIINPYNFFFVCGLGIGDIIDILRRFKKGDKQFLENLSKFNEYRKNFVHHILSSRIDIQKELDKALELTQKILDVIEKTITTEEF